MLHSDLAADHWFSLSVNEQMANIGSEVERSMKWKDKNPEYAKLANNRALELFDLTLDDSKYKTGIKEVARARELWLDYFLGKNQYHQTADLWRKYFNAFTYAARNL